MSKRFMQMSLALLAVALAYHVGAKGAGAQIGVVVSGGHVQLSDGYAITGVVGRTPYVLDYGNQQGTQLPSQVPGTSPVVSTLGSRDGNQFWALLENGDFWYFNFGTWERRGNLVGLPTDVPLGSWGQIKARYDGGGK